MCKRILVFLAVIAMVEASSAEKRTIACKTPAIASSCYWTHGSLSFYMGAVNFRLWEIGTHHLLGIYSGPSAFLTRYDMLDSENPQLPEDLTRAFIPSKTVVFADFEVCPLERHMQAACIESAKHIVVEK